MHPSHVVLERPHFHGTFSGSFLTFSLPEVASFDKIPDFIFLNDEIQKQMIPR